MIAVPGQMAGGPAVGAIGLAASIRVALLSGAAMLVPAAGLLAAAGRHIRSRGAAAPAETGDDLASESGNLLPG